MLGGHLPELVIVLTLALVVFGPMRLPAIGASLGKSLRDFRQSVTQLEGGAHHGCPITTELPLIELVSGEDAVR